MKASANAVFPERSRQFGLAAPPAVGLAPLAERRAPRLPGTRLAARLLAVVRGPFARAGALSVFDQGVYSGTSFCTMVIIARGSSPENVGLYSLALSLVMLVRGIQERLVCSPYMVNCHYRRGGPLAAFTGSVLVHQALLSLVVAIGLVGLSAMLAWGVGPAGLAPVTGVLWAAAPLLLLRECLRQMSFARLQVRTAIAVDLAVATMQLCGLSLLAILGLLSVPAAYVLMAGACAIACSGWFLSGQQRLRFVPSQWLPDWRQNWSFAKWALASQLVGCSAPLLMPWILATARDTATAGILAACTTLVGVGTMFVGGLDNVLGPQTARAFAQGGVAQLRLVLWKTAAVFAVALGSLCLVLAVAGSTIAAVVFGSPYAGCGPVITILALAVLANSISLTAGNGLWAMRRPSAVFVADVCVLTVTLALAFGLVHALGALGTAVAMLAGTLTGATVKWYTLLRLMAASRNPQNNREDVLSLDNPCALGQL
jgi:O-antigen/teichoic acid export membrane protein